MRQADAQLQILKLWRDHPDYPRRSESNVRAGFHITLEVERPELLAFKSKGDLQRQMVMTWLLDE